MLALEPLIAQRLRELGAFAGWSVREGCQDANRNAVPAVDVRMGGASVTQVRKPSVSLQPEWAVTVVVHRGSEAARQLDAALTAVVGSLHNWRPSGVPGRGWTELLVARVQPMDFVDVALVGYEITFTTVAVFDGQP
ncbi:MAG: hypothetical protein RR100_10450 [Comamonas sp.]